MVFTHNRAADYQSAEYTIKVVYYDGEVLTHTDTLSRNTFDSSIFSGGFTLYLCSDNFILSRFTLDPAPADGLLTPWDGSTL